jgi:hypothetical protein
MGMIRSLLRRSPAMLHALPFTTFGEAAALGLKAYVYCPTCYRTRG